MTRVLVVDDSVVLRQMVQQVLGAHAGLTVVGTAADGLIALDRIAALAPDVVLLDLDMPELDGLEVMRRSRARGDRARFLVFSRRVETGAAEAVEALRLGALDCVPKGEHQGRMTNALRWVEQELVPRLRAVGASRPDPGAVPRAASPAAPPAAAPTAPALPPARPVPAAPVAVLAVAASTGGPAALETLLGALPASLPVPVVLVQHMPAAFTEHFAASLDRVSPLRVRQARHGDLLRSGEVLVAPGDRHLVVAGPRHAPVAHLLDTPPEHSCRPAADPLFRSVASLYGRATLAVVLTGMGSDGCAGSRAIRDAGGSVLVQDAATSVVWGMPGAVAQAGLAHEVLPLGALAEAVTRRCRPAASVRAAS